jgi:hypothetical protein
MSRFTVCGATARKPLIYRIFPSHSAAFAHLVKDLLHELLSRVHGRIGRNAFVLRSPSASSGGSLYIPCRIWWFFGTSALYQKLKRLRSPTGTYTPCWNHVRFESNANSITTLFAISIAISALQEVIHKFGTLIRVAAHPCYSGRLGTSILNHTHPAYRRQELLLASCSYGRIDYKLIGAVFHTA